MDTTIAQTQQAFSDPELCASLLRRLERELEAPLRFMEVCGTHTVSIFRSGLRSILPGGITHVSGPGCPVCVTHDREIAAVLKLAENTKVIIATFGDLMRVPGPGGSSLKSAKAEGARVEVVYSPLNALQLAVDNPGDQVVFLGVGFETTAPAVAASVISASQRGLNNFLVLSLHKLVPPALRALLGEKSETAKDGKAGATGATGITGVTNAAGAVPVSSNTGIDAFLLPGHVSTVLGTQPYQFVAEEFACPCVIGGFEPADILQVLLIMVEQRKSGRIAIVNQYRRAVGESGNPRARQIMESVFCGGDALWRGLGPIAQSGLRLRPEYAVHDAFALLGGGLPQAAEPPGCRCGEVLKGHISPKECGLFGIVCTPAAPVGPCMVSTEGSCAAYYKYE